MPSSPAAYPADAFSQKTEAELLYLVQHPDFYHADVVTAARHELHQRGVDTRPAVSTTTAASETDFADLPAERRWVAPAVGLGLVVVALLGWRYHEASQPTTTKASKPLSTVLRAVPLRPLQRFDSLINRQVQQQKTLLPAAERADTTATRKYLLLARRYWTAENQSEYLYAQANQNETDDRFSGLLELNAEQWRSLTNVLVYDHKLQPTMKDQLAVMAHAADLRMKTISEMDLRQAQGFPVLAASTRTNRDSAFYLRQVLLGVPASQRKMTSLVPVAPAQQEGLSQGVRTVTGLPKPHAGVTPVYVLDGRLLHSDPSTGAPPAEVQSLPSDSLGRILVVQPTAAIRHFGPQAHDGAVVIYTKGALRFLESKPE